MEKKRYSRCFLPIAIAILTISLVSVTSCTKQSPFIPKYIEPVDDYYIEMNLLQMEEVLLSDYNDPKAIMKEWEGKSIIVKNVKVDELALNTLEGDHIHFNFVQCIPRTFDDLLELKEGDVIDLTGVITDIPLIGSTRTGIIVLSSCQFLPAGMYPLPLPGSGGPPIGGY